MRPGTFTYKGLSSNLFGIISKSVDRPLLPPMRARLVEIYGKHGPIDFGQNNYGIRLIKMHVAYHSEDFLELRAHAREISAWLTSKQWERLIFDDEPDKYYLARIYNAVGLDTLFRAGEADITFECQPFAYMAINTGADPTWETADFPWMIDIPWNMVDSYQVAATGLTSFTFEYPGTQEVNIESPQGSKFDLIITGTWTTLSLTLNGKTLNYTQAQAVSGTLTIDNIDMEVNLDGVNKLDAITGDIDSFLTVIPGSNILQVAGTGLNITVTIDFTPMWL